MTPGQAGGATAWEDYPSESRPGIRIPVKVPISVKAGPAATVTLAEETQRRAVIMVGRDRKPHAVGGSSVKLRPCRRNAKVANRRVGRRTPFLAGFKLHGPTCVRLTVKIAGEPE